ncbi:unnamed protein product [Prorocentrum cordatum]|uniref:Uncharacterized protein n=1 Tax=Prorocentrum cordatum TaxID=2364126 RepID=A0ABN9T392_9DINO|nr:unnamed protein product [Polarella glacialis]
MRMGCSSDEELDGADFHIVKHIQSACASCPDEKQAIFKSHRVRIGNFGRDIGACIHCSNAGKFVYRQADAGIPGLGMSTVRFSKVLSKLRKDGRRSMPAVDPHVGGPARPRISAGENPRQIEMEVALRWGAWTVARRAATAQHLRDAPQEIAQEPERHAQRICRPESGRASPKRAPETFSIGSLRPAILADAPAAPLRLARASHAGGEQGGERVERMRFNVASLTSVALAPEPGLHALRGVPLWMVAGLAVVYAEGIALPPCIPMGGSSQCCVGTFGWQWSRYCAWGFQRELVEMTHRPLGVSHQYASVLHGQGRLEEALALYNRSIEIFDDSALTDYCMAKIYLQLNQDNQACGASPASRTPGTLWEWPKLE